MIEMMLALGAGMQSVGALLDSQSQQNTYAAKADYYTRQAEAETIKADYDVARLRERTQRVVGKQANIYLGQGFTLDGSPSDVAWDTFTESEKDAYAIRFGATMRAQNYMAEAANQTQLGQAAKAKGVIGAITPWLGKGPQMAMQSFFPSGGGQGPSVFMGGDSNPYMARASWGAVA